MLFSDESFGGKNQEAPYIRIGLVCTEISLQSLRVSISNAHQSLIGVSNRFRKEIEGKELFQLFSDGGDHASPVERVLNDLSKLIYPGGPVIPIVVVSSRRDVDARDLAKRTVLARDAASAVGLDRDGLLAATALVWQKMTNRYQALLMKQGCMYGRIVADNFKLAAMRYTIKLVDAALWHPLRAKKDRPYICEVIFVPTRHDYMLQLADVITHFMWRSIQGIDSQLARTVMASVQKVHTDLDIRTFVDLRENRSRLPTSQV